MKNLPLISHCLIAYNQEDFVADAVKSLFSQTYSPLEIILSDDCSTDKTFEIISDLAQRYTGPHKVIINNNEVNIGLVQHYNKVVFELSSGEYISLAAGDDIAMPDKIEKSYQLFKHYPDASCVILRNIIINENGDIISEKLGNQKGIKVERITINNFINHNNFRITPHKVFKKSAVSIFDKFSKSCPTEDTTSILRCLLYGPIYISSDYGTYYRRHKNAISHRTNLFKIPFKDIYKQYKQDIEKAYEKSLIDKPTREKLLKRIKSYFIRRSIFYKMGEAPTNINYLKYYLKFLAMKQYSIKEKLAFTYNAVFK